MASRDNIDTAVRAAIACAATMIANQVAGKAARDAIFLSVYDISHLPTMVIGAAFASVIAVLLTARMMARFGPGRIVPWAFWLSAGLILGEWTLLEQAPALAAPLVYLHLAVFGAFLISGFWSLVSERFDPRTARRRMARIAAAATFGGMVGGLLAERVAAVLSTATMLPILSGMHVVCGFLVLLLRPQRSARDDSKPADEGPPPSGFKTLASVPYLRNLALLVLLGTIAANFLDYVFKATVAGRYQSSEELMRFFAIFYTGVGLVTFLVQSVAGRRLLERYGLARTAVSLPVAVVGGSLAALIAPGLASATMARAGESVLRSSLFRSAYELFFTPVSAREKRATKTFIDVGCDRLGDAVGGGLVRAVLLVVPQIAVNTVLLALAALAGGVAAVIVRWLHRGHVRALERNLMARAAELNLDTVEVGLASGAVLQTVATVDLRRVLEAAGASKMALQKIADERRPRAADVTTARVRPMRSSAAGRDPLLQRIGELRADDAGRVRAALEGPALSPAAVPHVISLLAWDEVTAAAVMALRAVAPRVTGQLIDALVDPDEEFTIRRRLPRVLAHCNTDRAVDGMLRGLADKRFEVRFRCSRALAYIHENAPDLTMDKHRVYAAVEREVAVDKRVWKTHRLLDEVDTDDERLGLVDDYLRERTTRSLEHVFTVLSLVLPTEPLRVAFRGLHTDDPHLHGTALEYLDSVLPSRIKAKLIPFLEIEPPKLDNETRSPDEILEALLKSSHSIEMSLEEFNRRRQAKD